MYHISRAAVRACKANVTSPVGISRIFNKCFAEQLYPDVPLSTLSLHLQHGGVEPRSLGVAAQHGNQQYQTCQVADMLLNNLIPRCQVPCMRSFHDKTTSQA